MRWFAVCDRARLGGCGRGLLNARPGQGVGNRGSPGFPATPGCQPVGHRGTSGPARQRLRERAHRDVARPRTGGPFRNDRPGQQHLGCLLRRSGLRRLRDVSSDAVWFPSWVNRRCPTIASRACSHLHCAREPPPAASSCRPRQWAWAIIQRVTIDSIKPGMMRFDLLPPVGDPHERLNSDRYIIDRWDQTHAAVLIGGYTGEIRDPDRGSQRAGDRIHVGPQGRARCSGSTAGNSRRVCRWKATLTPSPGLPAERLR